MVRSIHKSIRLVIAQQHQVTDGLIGNLSTKHPLQVDVRFIMQNAG